MKIWLKSASICLAIVIYLSIGSEVRAMAPTLALASTNDGDAIQVTVHGDANYNVLFGYTKVGGSQFLSILGKTDANGDFSGSVSTSNFNIEPSSIVRVTVNNQRSNELQWPSIAAGNTLLLSETSIVLPRGQSKTISAAGNGSNLLYLSNNSNPPIANVSISGNQITIQSLNYGSAVITVCANAANPICASTYVSVQNANAQPLVFSQGNVYVASGETVPVAVIGGSGNYVISNNSNSGIFQANVNGNNINLKALASNGFSAVTVCTSDMLSCGVINATASQTSSQGLTFSQTNPSIILGQTLTIGITGGTAGSYSILSNSNANNVSAAISGSTLSLAGICAGTSVITVCSNSSCGSINASVTSLDVGGTLKLSQNNLWLNIGQSQGVIVSGGSMPYSIYNESSSVLKTSLENNILTITGLSAGSTNVNVCSAKGACVNLAVLINPSTVTTNNSANFTLAPNNLRLFAGNSQYVTIQGDGTYLISGNSQPVVASAEFSSGNILVKALVQGITSISVCQSGGQCSSISVTVITPISEPATENDAVSTTTETTKTTTEPKSGKPIVLKFKFTRQLQLGLVHNDVKELQRRLQAEKLYVGKITGKFDQNTRNAVKKYQKKKNIRQTGNLGPATIAALNK